jgi:hypothetical protein
VELKKTDSLNINLIIIEVLNLLYENDTSKYSNICLLLSDRAPYATKVGRMLKEIIPGLKHITCVCHALHNLCETIRNSSPSLNKIVAFLKRILIKNKLNQNIFREETLLPIPKFPIITRWGTWLEFVVYLYTNFNLIKSVVTKLNLHAIEITEITETLESTTFELELRCAYDHKFLIYSIKI